MRRALRIILGIVLIIIGVFALLTPLSPSWLLAGTYRVGDFRIEDTVLTQASVFDSKEIPGQAEDTVQKNDEKTKTTISSDGAS